MRDETSCKRERERVREKESERERERELWEKIITNVFTAGKHWLLYLLLLKSLKILLFHANRFTKTLFLPPHRFIHIYKWLSYNWNRTSNGNGSRNKCPDKPTEVIPSKRQAVVFQKEFLTWFPLMTLHFFQIALHYSKYWEVFSGYCLWFRVFLNLSCSLS